MICENIFVVHISFIERMLEKAREFYVRLFQMHCLMLWQASHQLFLLMKLMPCVIVVIQGIGERMVRFCCSFTCSLDLCNCFVVVFVLVCFLGLLLS